MSKSLRSIQPHGISPDTCQQIACLISGQDRSPRWLIDHVQRWIPSLAMAADADQLQPTRAVLLRRVTAVAEAVQTLAAMIADTPTREFLEMEPFGSLDEANAQRVLVDLARRAQGVLACPSLVTTNGKPRAGRTKATPDGTLMAKTLCAAIIVETWTIVRGRQPSSRNEAASKAAQALWVAAGGGSGTNWGSSLAGWRPYFEEAGEPHVASLRQEVRRHLIESERWGLAPLEQARVD